MVTHKLAVTVACFGLFRLSDIEGVRCWMWRQDINISLGYWTVWIVSLTPSNNPGSQEIFPSY